MVFSYSLSVCIWCVEGNSIALSSVAKTEPLQFNLDICDRSTMNKVGSDLSDVICSLKTCQINQMSDKSEPTEHALMNVVIAWSHVYPVVQIVCLHTIPPSL